MQYKVHILGKSLKLRFGKGIVMTKANWNICAVAVLLVLPSVVQAQDYTYTTNFPDTNAITITGYTGTNNVVAIPDTINGLPVTSIGSNAFYECTNLTSVIIGTNVTRIGDYAFCYCSSLPGITIPPSITNIENNAFESCTSLWGVYFLGNAPRLESGVFYSASNSTVYYLPGTRGWEATFGDRPTALWLPRVTGDADFGVRTNQFGFNVNWVSGMVVVVEACTNLAGPDWSPLQTNTLAGDLFYFGDPLWTNYSERFYRAVTSSVDVVPVGMALIPAGTNSGTDPGLGAYSLTLTALLYMDKYEVTKAQWDEVYNWAITNGYSFNNTGSGKAEDHPVHSVNWYDCVKWCNARSEKEGRSPAYYMTSAKSTVYKTGQTNIADNCVNWNSGYRLPTEVEWQYAARGGVSGQRFPWGDTIDHDRANYNGFHTMFSYDLGYNGHDTRYSSGGNPYTSPAGSFEAGKNGYGLYDMAGNVWEWCWAWYPGHEGLDRMIRGGAWGDFAGSCRIAFCGYLTPSGGSYIGFRTVLPTGSGLAP